MTAPAPHAGRLTGLRKSYGPTTAVDGVDLEIAPGEIVALLEDATAADGTLRTLLAHSPEAHDIEVTGADLEEAFLSITEGKAR